MGEGDRDAAWWVKVVATVVGSLLVSVAVIAFFVGSFDGPDEDDLAEQVKQSMQSAFFTDNSLPYLTVEKVALIHASGNEYDGLATVRSPRGTVRDVAVRVTADGGKGLWHVDSGALLWARMESAAGAPASR